MPDYVQPNRSGQSPGDLDKEMGIKLRLGRSDEQIIEELQREGFPFADIMAALPGRRSAARTSWRWLTVPMAVSYPFGALVAGAVWFLRPMESSAWLMVGFTAGSLAMIVIGAARMSRALEGHGSWLNLFRAGGWVHTLAELEGDDRERYQEGFVVFGIGLVVLVLAPAAILSVAGPLRG